MLRLFIFFTALLVFPWSGAQAEERRVALVIGNAAYLNVGALANPANDASVISEALKRLDFEVIEGIDLDYNEMREILKTYAAALDGADVALFFYAGHGIQAFGENYVLPVDAKLSNEADISFDTIPLELIMQQMNRSARTSIVLLDACRNNPFEEELARALGPGRSALGLGQGLAEVKARGGVLVGYATEPGAVAYDGDGTNSPFTTALAREMLQPNVEINTMLTRVRARVYDETKGLQRPWTSSSLLRETFLSVDPAAGGALTGTSPEFPEAEIRQVSTLGETSVILTKPHYWTDACTARVTTVRLLDAPANGMVDIGEQMSVIGDFGPGRRLAGDIGTCASRPIVSKVVTYQPTDGFRGTDRLTIEIGSPGFKTNQFTYYIQVN